MLADHGLRTLIGKPIVVERPEAARGHEHVPDAPRDVRLHLGAEQAVGDRLVARDDVRRRA